MVTCLIAAYSECINANISYMVWLLLCVTKLPDIILLLEYCVLVPNIVHLSPELNADVLNLSCSKDASCPEHVLLPAIQQHTQNL